MALQKETKSMTLRLDEGLASKAQTIAEVEGATLSDVVREALVEHIERRCRDPEFQAMLKRNLERRNTKARLRPTCTRHHPDNHHHTHQTSYQPEPQLTCLCAL